MVVLAADDSVADLAYVTAAQISRRWRVHWRDVPDRLATETSTRRQFADGAATRSKRLEGAWGNRHGVFFAASYAVERSGTTTPPARR
jgi:hypothetical protein